MANCIINTDFYGKYGVLIIKEEDKIILDDVEALGGNKTRTYRLRKEQNRLKAD